MNIGAGTRLGRYEIRSKIGEGGMGEVYLAEDTKLHRRVAIKFLPTDSIANDQANKRLMREAQAAAKLDHPNICAVHEVAQEDGYSFIVMPYCEGESLDARIAREPLELSESVRIASQVADALAEAHAHSIIHRDIKPSNIMITPRGQAKVMDFGLAKIASAPVGGLNIDGEASTEALLTTPGTIIGTVPYMSPEQVHGQTLDARTDIFSFGAVLYEVLTGQRLFAAETPAGTISAILTKEPPPLNDYFKTCPQELQRIVNKCLAKDRERRYQTMRDAVIDLENVRRECESNQLIAPATDRATETIRVQTERPQKPAAFLTSRLLLIAIPLIVLAAIVAAYAFYFRSPRRIPAGSVTSVNSPAYDYYLRGKLNSTSENPEQNQDAIKILEDVTKSEPTFAPAYAELARAYGIRANYFAPETEKQTLFDKARLAAEKSIALDPNLAEGHFVRGTLLWTHANRFPHEQAIQSFKKAIALDPNLEEAHHQLGVIYFHIGLLDKATDEVRKALAINPSDTMARFRLGSIDVSRGQYEEGLAILKTVPREANPGIVDRATADALLHLGRIGEANRLADDALRAYATDEGGNVTSIKAILLAKSGKPQEAEAAIARAIEIGRGFTHFHHTTFNIARAYALMSKPDEAIKWLEYTADDGFPCYPLFENESDLNSLRKDERFIAFMAKLKQQWEHYNVTF